MLRRGVLSVAIVFALAAVLCACSTSSDGDTGAVTMRGGDGALGENVNLREISVEMQGNVTLVHLSFVKGSRYAGVEESKVSSVPAYEVTQLSEPPRICVAMDMEFTDYAPAGTVFQGSAVAGIFDCILGESGTHELFLQLSTPVTASCAADGSVLTLQLTPQEEEAPTEAWYVGLNAMPQYQMGQIPDNAELSPTMCTGYSDVILISKPFASEDEATKRMEQLSGNLPSSVPESALYTFSMQTDALPPYQGITDSAAAAAVAVLSVEGEPTYLPVFLDNGRFLAEGADGTVVYAVPSLPDPNQDTGQIPTEQLWARLADGSQVQYSTTTLYDVRKVAYSADGRYLAMLDAGPEEQVLYLYDTQTADMRNLGEEGFGDYTVSFAWDPADPVLYAMTGSADSLQLLRYDFAAAEGTPSITAIEERNGSESSIACANGRIYFADQETMGIYALDIATGERTLLGEGVDLALSSDGRYLAVLQMHGGDTEDVSFDLVVLDAATGSQIGSVGQEVRIENFMFGPDPDALYYTTQDDDMVSEEYPFAVLCYSVSSATSERIGLSKTENVGTSRTPGTLYFVYYSTAGDTESMLPVTYLYEQSAAS